MKFLRSIVNEMTLVRLVEKANISIVSPALTQSSSARILFVR